MEYLLHRFLLHFVWRGAARRILAGRHILHHKNPERHPGIALLHVSALIAASTYGVLMLVTGPYRAAAFMAGLIAGYLAYEYCHLAIHEGPAPRTAAFGFLRGQHLAHHLVNAHGNYAITLPLWDRVFGTALGRSRLDRSIGHREPAARPAEPEPTPESAPTPEPEPELSILGR
jgi:sterol desaturase/sphingolipid hydroxylase (fatty acid hydroxylase superfamily)